MKQLLLSTLILITQNLYAQTYLIKYVHHFINHKEGHIQANLTLNDSIAEYSYNRPNKILVLDYAKASIPFLKFTNHYYLSKNIMQEQRTLKNGALVKAEWLPNYEWKIKDEFKTIKGYKAQKATTKSIESPQNDQYYKGEVTAWFTTDIPISAGPARYIGLPGLILEIEYEKLGSSGIQLLEIQKIDKANFSDISAGTVFPKEDIIYFDHHLNAAKIEKLKK